jgi:adenosylcobinamide amidohydrolase
MAESFEALPDDGELKFFCFGVHSIDYEKADKWGDLLEFAKTYGARPEDYFYATIADIYDYAKATKSVEITDTGIKNPTKIDLYIKIDGRRHILKAGRSIRLEDN